jgi:hypothetical protein
MVKRDAYSKACLTFIASEIFIKLSFFCCLASDQSMPPPSAHCFHSDHYFHPYLARSLQVSSLRLSPKKRARSLSLSQKKSLLHSGGGVGEEALWLRKEHEELLDEVVESRQTRVMAHVMCHRLQVPPSLISPLLSFSIVHTLDV